MNINSYTRLHMLIYVKFILGHFIIMATVKETQKFGFSEYYMFMHNIRKFVLILIPQSLERLCLKLSRRVINPTHEE